MQKARVKDVSKITGHSEWHIYHLVKERKIPFQQAYKKGRIFFDLAQIQQWMEANGNPLPVKEAAGHE